LDFCVLIKVVLHYRHKRFALSRACISTADEDGGVFPLTGELYSVRAVGICIYISNCSEDES